MRDVLVSHPAADVPAALYATAEGRAFLAELEAYVDRYGRRADKWTIVAPSWTEDPTPVIERLQDFVRRPASEAPEVTTQAAAAARERAIAEARERPARLPGADRRAVRGACSPPPSRGSSSPRTTTSTSTTCRSTTCARSCSRPAAGSPAMARSSRSTTCSCSRPTSCAARSRRPARTCARSSRQRLAAIAEQRTIDAAAGARRDPDGAAAGRPLHALCDEVQRRSARARRRRGELRGSPGSAGTVRGRARIIHSIAESGRIEPGDILVAETTAPPWTPLFAIVGAVVTDTGGVLSHCAVVAREYGIPAVVGTGLASTVITDGQMLEVDGDAGIVRFV